MKRIARVAREGDGAAIWVAIEDGKGTALSAAPWNGGAPTETLPGAFNDDGTWTNGKRLAPVEPRKILCVGRNYRDHAKELGNEVPAEPMLFLKPSTSLIGPDQSIVLPLETISSRVDHEAELAVVIGKRLQRATPDSAMDAVFGYTSACDVTARDLQKKDGQWWRAKGMDTFCPVGPVVVSGLSPDNLSIQCRVNGELRQRGNTTDMMFSIAQVLVHVSAVMTLEPGDLILTGTPPGVGPIRHGDRLSIDISGIGLLEVNVV